MWREILSRKGGCGASWRAWFPPLAHFPKTRRSLLFNDLLLEEFFLSALETDVRCRFDVELRSAGAGSREAQASRVPKGPRSKVSSRTAWRWNL